MLTLRPPSYVSCHAMGDLRFASLQLQIVIECHRCKRMQYLMLNCSKRDSAVEVLTSFAMLLLLVDITCFCNEGGPANRPLQSTQESPPAQDQGLDPYRRFYTSLARDCLHEPQGQGEASGFSPK